MWEAIAGVLGIIAVILGYVLRKEKTQIEKAGEQAEQANRAIIKMRRKIYNGELMDVQEDLDALDLRIRALLRLRRKKSGP